MPFVDFAAVKEAVSFADAASYLSLDVKRQGNQLRGPCPHCQSGGDRALVITEGRGFYCFAEKKGGDVIALAAHVLDLPAKDAAQELAERAGIVQSTRTSSNTVRSQPESGKGLAPLSHLEAEHEAVLALGLDSSFCKEHGIGYATKGVVRGSIAIPFRDASGTLLGYFGCNDFSYIPPDFQGNVVPFQKRA